MPTVLDSLGRAWVSDALPQATPQAEDNGRRIRSTQYGELFTNPLVRSKHLLAREGTYWTVTNAAVGTALLLGAASTTFVDTTPVLYLYNTATITTGPKVYLDYIKLVGLLAHTGSTNALMFAWITDVQRALTTDNTTALTPVSPFTDAGKYGGYLQIQAQNSATSSVLAASQAQTKRIVARDAFPRWVGVLGDVAVMTFGKWDEPGGVQALTALSAAVPGRFVVNLPPLILGPGRSATLHMWQTANTIAPTAELEMGFYEK